MKLSGMCVSNKMHSKFNNNKVMCHLSMKLTDMFDPNKMHTSDKIVVKQISVKETLLKLLIKIPPVTFLKK